MKRKILIITIFMLAISIFAIANKVLAANNTNEIIQEKQVGEKEKWKHTFTLPKYDENGKLIQYQVDEKTIPEGYTKKIEGNTITNTINKYNYKVEYYYDGKIDSNKTDTISVDYGTIINTYTNKKTNGYLLDKEEGLGLKIGINEKNNIIKIYYKTERVTYSGTKTWKDDNNSQKLRPQSYTLKLYADDKYLKEATFQNGTWEFAELQKYDYKTGKEIKYTVQEDEIILKNGDKYVPTINGTNVVNTLTGTTTIEAKKIWQDNENSNNTRPENVILVIKKILSK